VDPHTGVADPASTGCLLETCLRDYQENRVPFGVLIVAIDELGPFGAKYGREAVFKMLHTVAATLCKNLRVGDTVGNWTENRFLALVLNCGAETLAHVKFVLKRVAGLAEISWWGERHSITVSVGGAIVRPDDTVDSLLARAEDTLTGSARNSRTGEDSILIGTGR
jgi:diguanylate cyclase (GGDEF)-like protein